MKTTRNTQSDIDRCVAGKCMGPFCPCLCHTSLKYDHSALPLRGRGNSKVRRDGRSRARSRAGEASFS
jgi:hypothetical protein